MKGKSHASTGDFHRLGAGLLFDRNLVGKAIEGRSGCLDGRAYDPRVHRRRRRYRYDDEHRPRQEAGGRPAWNLRLPGSGHHVRARSLGGGGDVRHKVARLVQSVLYLRLGSLDDRFSLRNPQDAVAQRRFNGRCL
jgi:hypothetical protein